MDSDSWRRMLPEAVRRADGRIYHYTDSAGLLGILSDKVLWATEASGMNDLAEVRQGWEFIRSWLKDQPGDDDAIKDMLAVAGEDTNDGLSWLRLAQSPHGVFVCSASLAADDANQWRLYGGAAHGYAIELNSSIELVPLFSGSRPETPADLDEGQRSWRLWFEPASWVSVTPWLHALYSDAEKEAALAGFAENVRSARAEILAKHASEDERFECLTNLREMAASDLARIAQLMKSPGFAGENEVRIIVSGDMPQAYLFRPTPYGIVRYARLAFVPADHAVRKAAYEADHRVETRKPIPMRAVTLGPLVQAEHNRRTIEALLRQSGPRGCEVRESSVRLRG